MLMSVTFGSTLGLGHVGGWVGAEWAASVRCKLCTHTHTLAANYVEHAVQICTCPACALDLCLFCWCPQTLPVMLVRLVCTCYACAVGICLVCLCVRSLPVMLVLLVCTCYACALGMYGTCYACALGMYRYVHSFTCYACALRMCYTCGISVMILLMLMMADHGE